MATIQSVINGILAREDVSRNTKEKYVKKFRELIKNCTNENFIERFNDLDYIQNIYLKNMKASTVATYVGDIFSINKTSNLMLPDNVIALRKYKDKVKNDENILDTPTRNVDVEPDNMSLHTESETEDIENEIEELTTLEKIDIRIKELYTEISELEIARNVIFKYNF
jgi:hypothetical protein